jgi:hypothetical protein
MNNVRRFRNALGFKEVDRSPMIELADWWDKTLERWKKEGLPAHLSDPAEIREKYFGLDAVCSHWVPSKKPDFQSWNAIHTTEDYENARKFLYPEEPIDKETMKKWKEEHSRGERVIWVVLEGFFWFPRTLFGIEKHLYAFFDSAETMHRINSDLLEYDLRVVEKLCEVCTPDIIVFAEDMSYNNGPMISKKLFDEFMAPYYKKIIPVLKDKGIIAFIDSDGKIDRMVPWFLDIGLDGFLPLEHQAGVDIVRLRNEYPGLKFIGGYDKMVMSKTEADMRREFERIFPVMKQGGYVVSVDHQTPPEVSLENYKIYIKLLREYCYKK